ncbi:MAG: NADPH:quinone oxidoreductase family protein [Gammaproteobacteria bacterium]|nr:NADPH:quinone oxidoreductase family protein [Gammaproteobacteria bacterium]
MRAVLVRKFGAWSDLQVEDVSEPKPGPRDVLIETANMGVNFRDVLLIGGHYQLRPPLPFAPGMECAGVIAEVGSEVTGFAPGDRVAAEVDYGAYAERVVAAADSCYRLPESMSFEHAAALGLAYQAAHFALTDHAHLSFGERVLVTGAAGGVGFAAVQIAKAQGGKVIAGIRGMDQAEVVREAGADLVVDLSVDDLSEHLREQVNQFTNDHGVDVALDPVGDEVFNACLDALAPGGRLVSVGFASGQVPTVDINKLLRRNLTVMGLNWRHYRLNEPDRVQRIQYEMYELYELGKLTPHVMHVYGLEDFARALELIAAGNVQGKVVLSNQPRG